MTETIEALQTCCLECGGPPTERTGTRAFAALADVGSSAEVLVRQWADQVHRVVGLGCDA